MHDSKEWDAELPLMNVFSILRMIVQDWPC